MARAATKKATKADSERRAHAQELVGIWQRNAKTFKRMDELKSRLKKLATDAGANFKEVFDGIGEVIISRAKEKEFKGNVPTIVPEIFNALPKKERDALIKKGIVKEVEAYKSAYYGAVEVKLF